MGKKDLKRKGSKNTLSEEWEEIERGRGRV